MRKLRVAAFLLSATAAFAGDTNFHVLQLPASPDGATKPGFAEAPPPRQAPLWLNNELLGDALGRWLGVKNGRWELFSETVALMGDSGPTIAGTVNKNAVKIQLRWRPGE
jgi:hypothetical protein